MAGFVPMRTSPGAPPDRVLVVDDEQNLRKVLAAMLRREGYEVAVAENGEQALSKLSKDGADVVVTDMVMPRLDGMALLRRCVAEYPDVPVILITAHGTVDSAVDAMKVGAFDYITKPFDQSELVAVIAKAARTHALNRSNALPETDRGRYQIIGQSPRMQEVYAIIAKVADAPSTVLITGESGTGKELVASALHHNSSRRKSPFIKINCAAIPKELMESELFGYERGAFTGAVTSKPGRFELADGGTLFLDEVGEIPVEMQVKLLRALQESEFERVGGLKTTRVDVRLVAATSRNLKSEIEVGRFREDLYYRLNVVPIDLAPLRERRDDIPLLAEHFREKYNKRLGKKVERIDPEALAALVAYPWPGNIRELENLLERTILFSEDAVIRLQDLPEQVREKGAPPAAAAPAPPAALPSEGGMKEIVKQASEEIEKQLIVRALEETAGNVTQAARKLQISRKSLQNKMKEYGLRDTTPEAGEPGAESDE